MTSPVRVERSGAVAVATLAMPERRNALSVAMLDALAEMLTALEADPAIRVLVLAADGPAFSSGHDLKELQSHRDDADRGEAFYESTLARCASLMTNIVRSRLPVIAAVEGLATAAGCQLVASCDLAVAGEGARFCTPGVDIGLFCSTPAVALVRAVPAKSAMRMLLTGEPIGAEEAHRVGLVNEVVPAEEALSAALALAATIAPKPPRVVALGKQAFYRQRDLPLDDAYALASRVMCENMMAEEAAEGAAAFLERRPPVWPD
ncbi:MAG: enoyl-CoA hydratase [Caulobacteraceae bacterium]